MLALLLLAALVTAGPPWRRALGLALAALLFPWCLALPGHPLLRAVIALLAFWGVARVVDLAREPRPMGPLARMLLVVAIVDTRRLQPIVARLDRRALLRLAVWVPLGLLALQTGLAHDPGPLRWACGALVMYALGETGDALFRVLLTLLGLRGPPIHRTPIVATSLREFWGERWNLVVNRWLREHCFLPWARRRQPFIGLGLAFLASAAIHAWFIVVALGPRMAAWMGLYFVIQGALLALELPLRVDRWSPLAARVWTLAGILVPAPLFVEPLLRLFATPPILV